MADKTTEVKTWSYDCKKTMVTSPFIMQLYEDTDYTYVCEADMGVGTSDSLWKITRYSSTGDKRFCDGDEAFDNKANKLASVAALSYS